MVYRSSNPALNPEYFRGGLTSERMTIEGTISKTFALLGLVSIAALASYSIVVQTPALTSLMIVGGSIGGLVLALSIIFHSPKQPPGSNEHVRPHAGPFCRIILLHD